MKMFIKKWLAILFLLASFAGMAQEKPNVAVYVIGNEDDGVKEVFGQKLTAAIVKTNQYIAVERTLDFTKIIDEKHATQRGGSVSDAQISELGKRFGAKYVCVVSVREVLNSKFVSAKLINTETAAIEKTDDAYKNYKTVEELVELANELTGKLFGKGASGYAGGSTQSSSGDYKLCGGCGDNLDDLEVFPRDATNMSWNAAIAHCRSKGNGWYLPSKEELNQLYLHKIGIGGFYSSAYWSSTASDISSAWAQNFGNGNQDYGSKSITLRVRCVRRKINNH